jgi:4-hydroxybenzoate polyprenyltransferase
MTTDPKGFQPDTGVRERGFLKDYVAIARFDHSTKHVFIIPGLVLAYLLRGVRSDPLALDILLSLATAVFIASANYTINEWFDRDFDRHHPTKSRRPAVQRDLNGKIVLGVWLAFIAAGLGCALAASRTMLFIATLFALQGVVYNVRPFRTKDKPHLDVISESVNNPLRLMIGWVAVDPSTLPPSSVMLSYWLGGAFLMGAKRLAEYREIAASHGSQLLVRYRASFGGYSEISLQQACFVYAMLSSFFLAVFLIKYRVEYLLLVPPITILFAYYLGLAMRPDSLAQKPEKLFRERGIVSLVVLLAALFVVTSFVDLPVLARLRDQEYINLW